MRRDADAATGVGAEAERRTAGGDNRGLATAAAARRARKVVGIIGPPVDQIVRLGRAREFGHIGLAKDDAAGRTQPCDRGGVRLGHEIGSALGAAGADHTGGFQRVLDGDGDAVKRTLDFAAGERRVGFIGLFPRRLRGQLNDRIEFGVDLGDPLQMRLDDLPGAPFLRSNSFSKLARRGRGDTVA